MVDKAAIFADVTRRNALRLSAMLPPLNVRAEYDYEVALAKERNFRDALPALETEYADDRHLIEAQVIGDLSAKEGKDFRHTKAGRWAIRHNTAKRFRDFLRERHGIETPPLASKNAIVYGSDADEIIVETDLSEPADA